MAPCGSLTASAPVIRSTHAALQGRRRCAVAVAPLPARRATPGALHTSVAAPLRARISATSARRPRAHSACAASASASPAAAALGVPPRDESLPRWVHTMNEALERCPVLTLASFVALDLGSALCLWAFFETTAASVNADFALAYALSKAVRVQRLALDAFAASALTRLYPPLAAVRISLLLDAAARLLAAARARLPFGGGARAAAAAAAPPGASAALLSRTGAEAKRLADLYGLAYMAAKNVIGPVSIALLYLALQRGLDVQGALGALGGGALGGAGRSAGRAALASWTSTALFPLVVLGAAHLGLALNKLFGGNKAPVVTPAVEAAVPAAVAVKAAVEAAAAAEASE
jgi:hypothetical protein